MRAGQFRVGTSGWIHKHWRGVFYPRDLPAGHWFGYYVQFFDTVEINFTFYPCPPKTSSTIGSARRRPDSSTP